jgi:formylglycine-generating enzyme required for sulfatase activity
LSRVGDNSRKNWRNPRFTQTDNHPVVCVSWNDATAYVKWLSQQTGKQYRLPSEAEWEYAARAGTEISRYWGNDLDDACRYANVADKTAKKKFSGWSIHNCTDGYVYTAPVGSFKSNAFGLYDTVGNVWEWTCSEYEKSYKGKEKHCLSKISTNNDREFVLRGGSWLDYSMRTRSAFRFWDFQTSHDNSVGVRLARQ